MQEWAGESGKHYWLRMLSGLACGKAVEELFAEDSKVLRTNFEKSMVQKGFKRDLRKEHASGVIGFELLCFVVKLLGDPDHNISQAYRLGFRWAGRGACRGPQRCSIAK